MTKKCILAPLYAICLTMMPGCESPPIVPVMTSGPVAVVPALYAPAADFNLYARGKGAAAGELGATGAASGAAAGAVVPLGMGPVGIGAYPLIAPFTILAGIVVGGTVGASYGAFHGLTSEEAARVDTLVDRAVHQIGVHEQIARRVVEKSRRGTISTTLRVQDGPRDAKDNMRYEALKQTFPAVLELAVDKVGMAVRKGDPPRVALEMKLRARVVCLATSCVSGEQYLIWSGKPRPIAVWQSGGAELMESEFEEGYETLAQYVWERLLDPGFRRISP